MVLSNIPVMLDCNYTQLVKQGWDSLLSTYFPTFLPLFTLHLLLLSWAFTQIKPLHLVLISGSFSFKDNSSEDNCIYC